MTEYYDYVLVLIPATLVGITAGLRAVGLDPLTAMPVGAAVSSLIAGHALFVNAPTVGSGASADPPSQSADRTPAPAEHAPPNAD
ncbi:MAG: hypothetical protein ABEI80_00735 [Haloplanus sp.]